MENKLHFTTSKSIAIDAQGNNDRENGTNLYNNDERVTSSSVVGTYLPTNYRRDC